MKTSSVLLLLRCSDPVQPLGGGIVIVHNCQVREVSSWDYGERNIKKA